jgi:hypothetical protein
MRIIANIAGVLLGLSLRASASGVHIADGKRNVIGIGNNSIQPLIDAD